MVYKISQSLRSFEMTRGTVISIIILSFQPTGEILTMVYKISQSLRSFEMTRGTVISTNGRNLKPYHLSFRPTGEILTNVYKISQSLRSFEMTRGTVISTNGRNLKPYHLSFRPTGEILTNVYKISQSLRSFEMTRGAVISTFLLSFQTLFLAVPIVVATKCPASLRGCGATKQSRVMVSVISTNGRNLKPWSTRFLSHFVPSK